LFALKIDLEMPGNKFAKASGSIELTCAGCRIGDGETKLFIPGSKGLKDGTVIPEIDLGTFVGKMTVDKGVAKKEGWKAGATIVAGAGNKGRPMRLPYHVKQPEDSFFEYEKKYAMNWAYNKGLMMPEEKRNPVDTELDEFFISCQTGKKPLANVEVGLHDSIGVMMANKAMDEGRRVYFKELEQMAPAALVEASKQVS